MTDLSQLSDEELMRAAGLTATSAEGINTMLPAPRPMNTQNDLGGVIPLPDKAAIDALMLKENGVAPQSDLSGLSDDELMKAAGIAPSVPIAEAAPQMPLGKQLLRPVARFGRSALAGLSAIGDAPRLITDTISAAEQTALGAVGLKDSGLYRALEKSRTRPYMRDETLAGIDAMTNNELQPQNRLENVIDFGTEMVAQTPLSAPSSALGLLTKPTNVKAPLKAGQELANMAKNEFNIPLTAAQVSNNSAAKTVARVSDALPLSGSTAFAEKQTKALTKAASNLIGSNADELTPSVMATRRKELGDVFDTVYSGVSPRLDMPFTERLQAVSLDAADLGLPDVSRSVQKYIDEILNAAKDGTIPAEKIAKIRTRLSKLSNSKSEAASYYGELSETLDDLLYRNLTPEKAEKLSKTREQYKYLKTLQRNVESTEGTINPKRLLSNVLSSPVYNNAAFNDSDKLLNLARISDRYIKPSMGSTAGDSIGTGGTVLGGAALGLPKTAAALGVNRLGQSLVNRNQKLVESLLRRKPVGATSKAAGSALSNLAIQNQGTQ